MYHANRFTAQSATQAARKKSVVGQVLDEAIGLADLKMARSRSSGAEKKVAEIREMA